MKKREKNFTDKHRLLEDQCPQSSDPYESLITKDKYVLFVNSFRPPDEEVPMNHYYYSRNFDGGMNFFRLHRVYYLHTDEEGCGVRHSLYWWKKIEVKSHCVAAMKQFIDSLASAEEFIVKKVEA